MNERIQFGGNAKAKAKAEKRQRQADNKVRGNMFPVDHEGEQIGVVEGGTRKNSNHRFVITADKETGVAVNVMRCSDAYIKSNYKK